MSQDTTPAEAPAKHDLVNRPIGQALRQLAIPAALGMLFTTMFNIVDIFFAGLLGTDAQAGLSLGYQGFAVLMAFGFGLSAAMGALVGQAVGAGDTDKARTIAGQGLAFAGLIGIGLMLLGWGAGRSVIAAISEPGSYRDAAMVYLNIMLLSLPCFIIAHGCNGILQAQGDAKSLQRALLMAAIANVGLNPLFIYGIPGIWDGMGLAGIATATVVAWLGVVVFMVLRVSGAAVSAGLQRDDLRPRAQEFRSIASQALPATFAFMILFMSGLIVTYALKSFGGHAVAGYGIAIRLEQILFLPLQGLTLALLPVVAQAYGAQEFTRMWEALRYCLWLGVSMAVAAAIVIWTVGGTVMQLFTTDAEVLRVGLAYLHIDAFGLPFYTMLFAFNSMFQALQRARLPLWIGLYRRGVGLALFIWLFIGPWGFDETGIWYAHIAAVVSGWMLASLLLWQLSRSVAVPAASAQRI